jgi:membrane protease subunit HflK
MRRLRWLLPIALAAYLLTGLTQVRPGERGVVRRFGAVVARPGPGPWFGLPWPLERVDRVPLSFVRPVTVGFVADSEDRTPAGQLLTGDHNLVNVQLVLQYAVRDEDDSALDEFVLHRDQIDGLIARCAETALAEWVAAHGIDDVLLTGKDRLRRWLVERTQEQLRDYRVGVAVKSAEVAYLAPPDEVKGEFDAVTRAQTAIRTREYEAHQDERRILQSAKAQVYEQARLGEAYVYDRLVLAQAEAESFTKRLEQYRRLRADNPDVLAAIWWDEMGKVFGRLKEAGRIDLLDNHVGADGLDITQFTPSRNRRR